MPVIDEYRKRTRSPKPLRLHRFRAMCCATITDVSGVADIYEFDEDLEEFSKTKTINFQMPIHNVIYSRGKMFAVATTGEVTESIAIQSLSIL